MWIGAGALLLAALTAWLALRPTAPEGALGIPWLPERVDRWAPQLAAAASEHGVDPQLLAIIALVESSGDPRATSHAGARGLCQIMPATGHDIARRRGITAEHRSERLYDPAYNADLAAWFLARQLRSFGSDVELAAAAYNGGPGRVRRWLQGRETLPRETRRYKALVKALYRERSWSTSPTWELLRRRRGM